MAATSLQRASGHSGWFGSGGNNIESKPLKAEGAWKSREQFAQRFQGKVDQEYLDGIYNRDKEYLKNLVDGYLGKAEEAKNRLLERREKGVKRAAARFQKFLNTFAEFLEAYSGIVEILKCADSQYGGLAYGTLSLLFIVAVNKQAREDIIESTLSDMLLAFPRLDLLNKVYPNTKIESLVDQVYKEVIEFARKSATYYSRPSYARICLAITAPPKSFAKRVDSLKGALAQVNAESAVLLDDRVGKMWAQLEEDKTQKCQKRLSKLERILEENLDKSGTDLHACKELFGSVFDGPKNRHYRQINMQTLKEEDCYTHWRTCDNSCLLILSGKNHPSKKGTSLCWLSPIAVSVVEEFCGGSKPPVPCAAYYSCQTENWQDESKSSPAFEEILSSIICQVLRWNSGIMMTKYEEVKDLANGEEWKDPNGGILARFKLLTMLLPLCKQSEVVYLVLDRLDRCSGDRQRFLEGLARMVKDDECIIKIFAVIDSTRWPEDKDIKNLRKQLKEERFVERLGWSQETWKSRK